MFDIRPKFEEACQYLDILEHKVPPDLRQFFYLHRDIAIDYFNNAVLLYNPSTQNYEKVPAPNMCDKHYALSYYLGLARISGEDGGWISEETIQMAILYKYRIEYFYYKQSRLTEKEKARQSQFQQDIYSPINGVYPNDPAKETRHAVWKLRGTIKSYHPCKNIIEHTHSKGYRYCDFEVCTRRWQ